MATSSAPDCSSPSACRSILAPESKSDWPRSARSASTVPESACSPSTTARGRTKAGQSCFGGGDPTHPGAVSRREKIRRAGFAGKEQAIIYWSSEHSTVIGVARKRKRIRTTRPGIMPPGGGGEGQHALADVVAKEPSEFAGSKGEHCRLPFPFKCRCKAPAEKAIDRRPVERPHLVAHRLSRRRRTDQVGIVLDPGGPAIQRNEQLVVNPERQSGGRCDLVRQWRIKANDFARDDRSRHGYDDATCGHRAAHGFKPDRQPAMVDTRHRSLKHRRQAFGQCLEQPAVPLAEPPVGAAVLVADIILNGHSVEFSAVPPSTRRIE